MRLCPRWVDSRTLFGRRCLEVGAGGVRNPYMESDSLESEASEDYETGGPTWIRTKNQEVMSHLLYR
jgi:hypothetical protein